jgi:hypothetical protein
MEPWEADKALKRHFGAERCVVPEVMKPACTGDIVRAHTVSKSGSLKRIARSGHVYAIVPSVMSLVKGSGILAPTLRGVNRASTFSGFCSYHDKNVFSPVEDVPFEFTDEQCFLLAYRAQAREAFLKQAQLQSLGLTQDAARGRPLDQQRGFQKLVSKMSKGTVAGADDTARHKLTYDAVLQSGDYSVVRSYIVELDRIPTVMCSGGLFPYECFDGSIAQDLMDTSVPAQAIYYNSFAAGDLGGVVFTWLPDSDAACGHFVSTLEAISDDELTDALIRFFFEYCENVHLGPEWWEGLDPATRKALVRRLNTAANPLTLRRRDCLAPDGLRYDDWAPRMRARVGLTSASTPTRRPVT